MRALHILIWLGGEEQPDHVASFLDISDVEPESVARQLESCGGCHVVRADVLVGKLEEHDLCASFGDWPTADDVRRFVWTDLALRYIDTADYELVIDRMAVALLGVAQLIELNGAQSHPRVLREPRRR